MPTAPEVLLSRTIKYYLPFGKQEKEENGAYYTTHGGTGAQHEVLKVDENQQWLLWLSTAL